MLGTLGRGAACAALALLGAGLAGAAPGSRYQQLTRKFEKTPDQAQVVAAGYLGGGGTEWLASGGFQPDGTIVVVGVALGPDLSVGGTAVTVLGEDGPAPPAPERRVKRDSRGRTVKDKKGNVQYEPFDWAHPAGTAFVARLSADLKTVKSAARFPWKAGGATSAAVDEKGFIYLTGPVGEKIASVAGKHEALPVKHTGMKKGGCKAAYLCKLSPDAGKVLWVRTRKGLSDAPEVALDGPSRVRWIAGDLRTISPDGKQEPVTVIAGGITTGQGGKSTRTTAISAKDEIYVRAGARFSPTGRETYRAPELNVYRLNGKLLYELYQWDGPLVGLDSLRLVSDSAVRRARFDEDGNLLLYAWSDGGNSVLFREPNDLRRVSKQMGRLGFSATGAGSISCAYLIRLDTKTWKVAAGTPWLAYRDKTDKPNSIWVDTLGVAEDSVCVGGNSSWGLIRTGNALDKGEPTGPYVAVFDRDFTTLRFSSTLPGTAQADLRDGCRWGVVRGTVNDKPMVLFVGSAAAGAPTAGGLPSSYGGGDSDGYLLLLDLSKKKD